MVMDNDKAEHTAQRYDNNTCNAYYCKQQKCGTQQPKMAAASRVCVLLPLLEYRVRRSLKQRQAALYNPIDEVNDFLTTVLVIASDDNVHQAV